MNQEIKRLWVTALRSGEYKQAEGALKTEDGYCCLGVLNQIRVNQQGITWEDSLEYSYEFEDGSCDSRNHEDEDLPPATQKWAGLESGNPDISFEGDWQNLAMFNDGDKKRGIISLNFKQIADLIEAQL